MNGVCKPTVGDYTGDGSDDIVWYAPGSTADYLWESTPGSGFASHRLTINGVYRPVSGSFGNDRTDDVSGTRRAAHPTTCRTTCPGAAHPAASSTR